MSVETSEVDDSLDDDLRPEYDLAALLVSGVRGKYAAFAHGTTIVRLDPDVAEAFPTEEAVNEALRLVIRLAELPIAPADTR